MFDTLLAHVFADKCPQIYLIRTKRDAERQDRTQCSLRDNCLSAWMHIICTDILFSTRAHFDRHRDSSEQHCTALKDTKQHSTHSSHSSHSTRFCCKSDSKLKKWSSFSSMAHII